jgi:hypothetical protein
VRSHCRGETIPARSLLISRTAGVVRRYSGLVPPEILAGEGQRATEGGAVAWELPPDRDQNPKELYECASIMEWA